MTGKKKPGRMVKSVEVKATPEEVWQALAEAEGLARWFAPEVRVKPGPGGEVYLAWGGQGGTAKIEVWEPPRRLRTADQMGGVPATIEYEVEAKGGGTTVVRLVQSGFEEGSDTEASLDRGWDLFLANLRFALERGRGLGCTYAFASFGPGLPGPETWKRLLGPALLGLTASPDGGPLDRLAPGAVIAVALPGGERFEAQVDLLRPEVAFGAARLDRPERLTFTVEPSGMAFVLRLAFGLSPAEGAALSTRWTEVVRAAAPVPG
jgi:uncharacterized protein YndB with AHSA1/START domain